MSEASRRRDNAEIQRTAKRKYNRKRGKKTKTTKKKAVDVEERRDLMYG